MEGEEGCKEARVAVENDRMLTFELEAAEALAGMARCSSVREMEQLSSQPLVTEAGVVSLHRSQVQARGAQHFCGDTSTMVVGPLSPMKTVDTAPSQTCRASYQSKISSTLRQNLTQAEKEARKLRRVLANRESARRTICRRQVMYLELTEKAAALLAENTYLKKEKNLTLNKYSSLKEKNQFLKAEMVKRKEAEPAGETQEEPRSSRAEISCSATAPTPIFLCGQPSLVPFFWPSIVPSDIFNMQCASHSDITSSSHFHVPIWDKQCPNQGQKCSAGINKPGTPLFLSRVPWLLPFLPLTSTLKSCSGNSDRQDKFSPIHHCHMCSSSATLVHKYNHKLSSNQNTRAASSNSSRTVSGGNVLPPVGGRQYTGPYLKAAVPDVNAVSSVSKRQAHGFLKKYQRPFISHLRKSGYVIAATEARRKRKELMKLKNIHFHNAHT